MTSNCTFWEREIKKKIIIWFARKELLKQEEKKIMMGPEQPHFIKK